jgi:transcriptional regulator GlxA family with amidase domain
MLRSVAVPLIDGVAPFEFGVLCEVFGFDRTDEGVPLIDFRVCGEVPNQPVATNVRGVSITPEFGFDAMHDADLIAVPAVQVRDEYPEKLLKAIRETDATLLSVCNGAYVLGEAGLLDDRRCTTHWREAKDFQARFPKAHLDADVLFVDDGNIITSAGTAAGIDACLHLVRRELGTKIATTIARRMVVPPQRDGGQRQFVEIPIPECGADSLEPVLEQVLERIADNHTVASMAKLAVMSERTFARRFVAETGTTPNKWLSLQRVLHARRLLEETDLDVDAVAVRSGFGTAALLRHHFHRVVGVAPSDYRRTFACR